MKKIPSNALKKFSNKIWLDERITGWFKRLEKEGLIPQVLETPLYNLFLRLGVKNETKFSKKNK